MEFSVVINASRDVADALVQTDPSGPLMVVRPPLSLLASGDSRPRRFNLLSGLYRAQPAWNPLAIVLVVNPEMRRQGGLLREDLEAIDHHHESSHRQ